MLGATIFCRLFSYKIPKVEALLNNIILLSNQVVDTKKKYRNRRYDSRSNQIFKKRHPYV
jgi:hypothetical protein